MPWTINHQLLSTNRPPLSKKSIQFSDPTFLKKKIEYNGSSLVQQGKTIKTKKVWRMGKDQSLEKDGDKSDFK